MNDYNFWQNKSGEINLILGIALTPFLMQSWVFSLCYWNSVCWSLSCQLGYYFCFPWLTRKINARMASVEEKLDVSIVEDPENQSHKTQLFEAVAEEVPYVHVVRVSRVVHGASRSHGIDELAGRFETCGAMKILNPERMWS